MVILVSPVVWFLILGGLYYFFTRYGEPTLPGMERVGGLEDKVKGNYNCICEHTCFVLRKADGVKDKCPVDTRIYVVLADDLSRSDVQEIMNHVAKGKSLLADVGLAEILFRAEQPAVDLIRQDSHLEPKKANTYKDKSLRPWSLPPGFLNLRGYYSFEVEAYRPTVSDKPFCPIPPTEIDVSYRESSEDHRNPIADALVSLQGSTPYGIGLRFKWCKGQVLLTSLNIERWPMQDEWDPDGLAAFAHLIDSIAPDNGKSQRPCECGYSRWRAFCRLVVELFLE